MFQGLNGRGLEFRTKVFVFPSQVGDRHESCDSGECGDCARLTFASSLCSPRAEMPGVRSNQLVPSSR